MKRHRKRTQTPRFPKEAGFLPLLNRLKMCRTALPRQVQRVESGRAALPVAPFTPEDIAAGKNPAECMDAWLEHYNAFHADFYFLAVLAANAFRLMETIASIQKYSTLKRLLKGLPADLIRSIRDGLEHFYDRVPGGPDEDADSRYGFDGDEYYWGGLRLRVSEVAALQTTVELFIEEATRLGKDPSPGPGPAGAAGITSMTLTVIAATPNGQSISHGNGGPVRMEELPPSPPLPSELS